MKIASPYLRYKVDIMKKSFLVPGSARNIEQVKMTRLLTEKVLPQ